MGQEEPMEQSISISGTREEWLEALRKSRESKQPTDWRDIATAPRDGELCELRFRGPWGWFESPGPFFLHDDGQWYGVKPPALVPERPTHWRPFTGKVPR